MNFINSLNCPSNPVHSWDVLPDCALTLGNLYEHQVNQAPDKSSLDADLHCYLKKRFINQCESVNVDLFNWKKQKSVTAYHPGHVHTQWGVCPHHSFHLHPCWNMAQWTPDQPHHCTGTLATLVASTPLLLGQT